MKVELDENNLSGTKVEGWIRLRSLYVVPAHMLHAVEHFQLHPRSGGNEDRGVGGEMGSMWCTPDKEGDRFQTYRMNTQRLSVREDWQSFRFVGSLRINTDSIRSAPNESLNQTEAYFAFILLIYFDSLCVP